VKTTGILCLTMALGVLAPLARAADPPPPAAAPSGPASSTAGNSVVKVFATVLRPDTARPWTKQAPAEVTGSGAVIDGERILTNAHVVLYASQVEIQANRAGDKLLATVLATAPGIDLALLKVDDAGFFREHPPLQRASALPRITDAVYAYGFPTGGNSLAITKGIVSRIEFVDYGIAAAGLRIQVDAALNPGNSGGPVLADDRMIGLAFGTAGNNIGYIIPNEEIELFLKGSGAGQTYRKPAMYDELQTLENSALRRSLALDKSVHGIVVHRPYRTDAAYPLKEWDVISAIGGTPIDDQGMVTLGDDLRVRFQYLIQSMAKGDSVPLTVLRGGKSVNVSLPLVAERPYLVRQLNGGYPEYFIYGPLVFARAALEHLQNVYSPAMMQHPRAIYGMFQSPLFQQLGLPPSAEREEVVIVCSPFFPDKLTAGYDNPSGATVARINGKSVRSLKHLVQLLRDAHEEFITIEFDQPDREALVFARQELAESTERVLSNNGIRAQGSAEIMQVWQGH
jgi:S1-C subfamily serine protease